MLVSPKHSLLTKIVAGVTVSTGVQGSAQKSVQILAMLAPNESRGDIPHAVAISEYRHGSLQTLTSLIIDKHTRDSQSKTTQADCRGPRSKIWQHHWACVS